MVAAVIRLVTFSFGVKLTCESSVREAMGYLTMDGPTVLLQVSSKMMQRYAWLLDKIEES